MWVGYAEFLKHVLVGVEAIVNKDICRINLV
jgi:hypothetical protein